MSRQTGDMEAIRHFVALVIYAVYQNVLLFIFALLMIFTVNIKLALCMLVVVVHDDPGNIGVHSGENGDDGSQENARSLVLWSLVIRFYDCLFFRMSASL